MTLSLVLFLIGILALSCLAATTISKEQQNALAQVIGLLQSHPGDVHVPCEHPQRYQYFLVGPVNKKVRK